MIINADFASLEDYRHHIKANKPFTRPCINWYLRIEEVTHAGITIKVKFQYRHCQQNSINLGPWVYLTERDVRNILPLNDFSKNNIPFCIVLEEGSRFYTILEMQVGQDGILQFILQCQNHICLN